MRPSQTAGLLLLPPPPDVYNVLDQRQTRDLIARYAQSAANLPGLPRPFIYAESYGVVGDGVTDDTTAMQAALDDGATLNAVVYAGSLVVAVTAGLTMSGPGLVFDLCGPGAPGNPGLVASGAGYTVLEVSGHVSAFNVGIYSTDVGGAAVNGFYFNNPQQSQFDHIRAYNLRGYGARLGKTWDCDFYSVSVELCVDDSVYAFGMYPEGDTCNMTTIHHLQVERCGARTIYVDPSSLCCSIQNIHSEQSVPSAGVDTWVLSGASCQYEMCRFSPSGTASDATLKLSGENNTFGTFRVEGSGTVTKAEANSGVSNSLIGGNFATLQMTSGQTGQVNVYGGTAVKLKADPGFRVQDMIIATLECGLTANPADPTLEQFYACTIGTLTSTSTLSAATFVDCTILECNDLLDGETVLDRCVVTSATTINLALVGASKLLAAQSTINANLVHNGAPVRSRGTRFNGTVSSGGGGVNLLFDAATIIGAGSSGVGVPTSGAHVVGDRHVNPLPAGGGTMSWVCTVAGTPGTFTAEATTGGAAASSTLTIGTHLTGGSYNGTAPVTLATDATSANTASTIVARDGSGNIAVGGITASGPINASSVTGTFNHVVTGDVSNSGDYFRSGTRVVTSRQTGWSASTGTPQRTGYATGAATLADVAQTLKALVDDLISHGLIGP